ncbi:hypothetical protein [Streptomyces sp. NBC_00102]|uniref:hypothetical protein n=1 Tax=Streptomyces sp. NBC_00102 TaxID=2975652 RepID=UPI002258E8C0|nr:hypothetical protein [Streptomyces sp. NBC_00102]MCX5395675.1 hypothetical protein [Streptomyces sp. NBC_00102]
MTDTTRPQPAVDAAVRDFVNALLRQRLADEEARREGINELERTGHRIIDGGQTNSYLDTWEITDWHTGEVIVGGTGGYEAYDAAAQRFDPDGMWVHIDNVDNPVTDVEHPGLPTSLAEALQDWLGSISTSDRDVAGFVGWSVEEVARHRAEY